jgi:probable HAF family extracellular repeat protein
MRKIFLATVFYCLVLGMFFWGMCPKSSADKSVPHYTVTDLTAGSKQKYSFISAAGVNDKGEVVGQADGRAFWWRNGKLSFIGRLPGSTSCGATDINNAGQIVGTCSFGEWDKKYFFWQNGKMHNLGAAPFILEKIAINQRGEVLLHAQNKKNAYAALWRNGRQKSLGNWWPWAINDNGEVAGVQIRLGAVNNKSRPTEPDKIWAVVWQNGVVVSAGKEGSMAMLLNNNHDIVYSEDDRSVSPNLKRMFLVSGGKQIQLGQFQADKDAIYPSSINDYCQIAGYKFNGEGAVLWHQNQWHRLNDLIPIKSNWLLETAKDINERGQIIGSGKLNGKRRSFLLTPISQTAKP